MATNYGNDLIKFGGVSLRASEVKSKGVLADEKGVIRYVVDFKNGTKVAYEKSNGNIFSAQSQLPKGSYMKSDNLKRNTENNTFIDGVKGLEVVGTKNVDIIEIQNSTIYGVDVSQDKGFDNVHVTNSKGTLGERVLNILRGIGNKIGCGDINVDSHDKVNVDNKSQRIYKSNK